MKIGKELKNIRKKYGYTQASMAKELGIAGSYLSDIENDKCAASMRILESYSRICGRPVPVLLFQAMHREDVPLEKRQAFDLVKPAMDALIYEVFK
jgi:transcriptional regulator with XRE-family HTH domain